METESSEKASSDARFRVAGELIVGPGGPYSVEGFDLTNLPNVAASLDRALHTGMEYAKLAVSRPIDLRDGRLENPYRVDSHFGDICLMGPGGVQTAYLLTEAAISRYADMLRAAFDLGFEERLAAELAEAGITPAFHFGDTAASIGLHTPDDSKIKAGDGTAMGTALEAYAQQREQGPLSRWEIMLINFGYAAGSNRS